MTDISSLLQRHVTWCRPADSHDVAWGCNPCWKSDRSAIQEQLFALALVSPLALEHVSERLTKCCWQAFDGGEHLVHSGMSASALYLFERLYSLAKVCVPDSSSTPCSLSMQWG